MPHFPDEIEYSEKYQDDTYEYRHVLLPKAIYKQMKHGVLLTEIEWRRLGVQQSRGWYHYEIHNPEPYILLFRRPLQTNVETGRVPEDHPLYYEHINCLEDPNWIRRQAAEQGQVK